MSRYEDEREGNDVREVPDAREGNDVDVLVSEERLAVATQTVETGRVKARKHVEQVPYEQTVSRGVEHADLERAGVEAQDNGEVITLADGSLSIPVFEEQIVVTKRLVVRERVVIRKHTVYDEQLVTADLRREHLEVELPEGWTEQPGLPPA